MERAEKIGLGIATAGHVLLFGLLSLGLMRAPEPLTLNNPPMDVSIVDEVALRSAAPRIAPEAPPPSAAPEAGPQQEAAPAPEPALPKPLPKLLPKLAAEPAKPAPAKIVTAKPVPAKAESKPAAGAGAATATRGSRLNLDPSKWMQAAGTGATPSAKPTAGTPAATIGPAQKAALDAEIRRQIKPYWKSPTGADVEQLRTIVDVQLARDGSIVGDPQVVDTLGVTPSNQGQMRLHREQAVKAIRLAAPFKLPADLYSGWKLLRISFDKRLSQ